MKKNPKIIIAPDSFKGTLTASEVCKIWSEAFAEHFPEARLTCVPMSDGGDGALECIKAALTTTIRRIDTTDPLGRVIQAEYALFDNGQSAFIESASACGINLLTASELNPMRASSFGAGLLILDAMQNGARKITVTIGGSATVDGGIGLIHALGAKFQDKTGQSVSMNGAGLSAIASIDISGMCPLIKDTEFITASDVTNPLLGPNGAAAIFGPQKGASPDDVSVLEQGLGNFAKQTMSIGLCGDCEHNGDGAAGGIGFALRTYLKSRTVSGAIHMAELVSMEKQLEDADLLITGEGRTDRQTMFGKLPSVLADIAARQGVPVLLCSGAVQDAECLNQKFTAVFSTLHSVQPLDQVLANAAVNLKHTANAIVSTLRIGSTHD